MTGHQPIVEELIALGATVTALADAGFWLGLIMVRHRSIWPAVLAHGAFDATSMALIPWAMEQLQHLRALQRGDGVDSRADDPGRSRRL